jgi:hypothetical protein
MSEYAATPETYAAWRYLELTDELRPFDGEHTEMLRRKEELTLLRAGTEYSVSIVIIFLSSTSTDLQGSLTIDNVESFLKRGLELRCLVQRSVARNLERYRCQNVCIADLEARPEAYPELGTVEEIRQHVAAIRRNDGDLARFVAEIEEGQRSHADNENLLATLNTLIAGRRAQQQDVERELDMSSG